MNDFIDEETAEPELLTIDPTVRDRQIRALTELKSRRDNDAVVRSLDTLRVAAAGTENLIPAIMIAVEGYATVGEISDVLRGVWGEHRETNY